MCGGIPKAEAENELTHSTLRKSLIIRIHTAVGWLSWPRMERCDCETDTIRFASAVLNGRGEHSSEKRAFVLGTIMVILPSSTTTIFYSHIIPQIRVQFREDIRNILRIHIGGTDLLSHTLQETSHDNEQKSFLSLPTRTLFGMISRNFTIFKGTMCVA